MAESKVERPRGSLDAELQQAAITLALLVTAPPGVPVNVDVIDRAARLLGVIYGSQAAQLQQKAGTLELLVKDEGPATPLTTQVVTLADQTLLTPAAGNRIRLKYVGYSNRSQTDRRVSIKFTAAGVPFDTVTLAGGGGGFNMNLIGCNTLGGVDEALIANLDANDASGVDVTIRYVEE